MDIYIQTLKKHDGNFSKDIYNALILSCELKKKDTFFTILDFAKYKDFSIEYIQSLEEFAEFRNDPRWRNFKKNNLSSYTDTVLRNKMDSIFLVDQFFRKKEGSYEMYGDTISKIDSTNVKMLTELIYKSGLPSEKEIGAKNFKGEQGYDIVLHHWSQARSRNKKILNLTPFLVFELQSGRIEPHKAAYYLEMQNDDGFHAGVTYITKAAVDTTQNYFVPKYSEIQLMQINLNRKWLYLESLEEFYEKARYIIRHPEKKYFFNVYFNTYYFATAADYEMYKKYEAGIELK